MERKSGELAAGDLFPLLANCRPEIYNTSARFASSSHSHQKRFALLADLYLNNIKYYTMLYYYIQGGGPTCIPVWLLERDPMLPHPMLR